jgi:hypothetical protein
LISALPLTAETKAPRKARRAPSAPAPAIIKTKRRKTPADEGIAAAIAEAAPAPTPEPEPEPEPEATTEPTPEPEPEATTTAPALDPIAAKRAKKTLAQRLRRAARKASIQWRGNAEMTAAAE